MQNNIFGTDGVRGIVGTEITPHYFYELAKALAIFACKTTKYPKILLGTDTRKSRYMLASAIKSGLTAHGAIVTDIHIVPTPVIAYLTSKHHFDYGIMLTASHNPETYNGIKIFNSNGEKIALNNELEISEIFQNSADFQLQTLDKIGRIENKNELKNSYIDFATNSFSPNLKGKRILLDCANGATSQLNPLIFTKLGAIVTTIGNDLTKSINDKCGVMHINNILSHIEGSFAPDFSFSYDGDGDRLIAITKNKTIIDGDAYLYLFGKYLKKRNMLKSNTLVGTVMTNYGTQNSLEKLGISLIRTNVGDKYITQELFNRNLTLGAENSGHIIFSNYTHTGDALVASLKLCELAFKEGIDIDAEIKELKQFDTLQKNIAISDSKRTQLLSSSKFLEVLYTCEQSLAEHGRILVRPSGTEHILRILIESDSQSLSSNVLSTLNAFILEFLQT